MAQLPEPEPTVPNEDAPVEAAVEAPAETADTVAEAVVENAVETPPHPRAFRIDPALGRSIGMGYADRLLALGALGFRSIAAPPEDMADEAKIWWRWDGLAGEERQRPAARGRSQGRRHRGEGGRDQAQSGRHQRAADALSRAHKGDKSRGAAPPGDGAKDSRKDGPQHDQRRGQQRERNRDQRARHGDGRSIAREREIAAHSPFAALKDMMATAKPDARDPQKVDGGDTPAG